MQNQIGQQRELKDYGVVYKQYTQHQSQEKGFQGKVFRHMLGSFEGSTVGSHINIAVADEFSRTLLQDSRYNCSEACFTSSTSPKIHFSMLRVSLSHYVITTVYNSPSPKYRSRCKIFQSGFDSQISHCSSSQVQSGQNTCFQGLFRPTGFLQIMIRKYGRQHEIPKNIQPYYS